MKKLMLPEKVRVSLFIFACLLLEGEAIWLINNMETYRKYFPIETHKSELVMEATKNNDTIDIYQLEDKKIVINTYSKNELDEPKQLSIDTNQTISKDNISISWLTTGSNQEKDIFGANIKIVSNEGTLFEEDVSFIEVATKALNEAFGNHK